MALIRGFTASLKLPQLTVQQEYSNKAFIFSLRIFGESLLPFWLKQYLKFPSDFLCVILKNVRILINYMLLYNFSIWFLFDYLLYFYGMILFREGVNVSI